LIAIYAAFNVGATLGSVGFARFGEAFGPAAVFPLAAALGLVGLFTLWARVPRARPVRRSPAR
jgi:predicted MFS family arabinose efflux permease